MTGRSNGGRDGAWIVVSSRTGDVICFRQSVVAAGDDILCHYLHSILSVVGIGVSWVDYAAGVSVSEIPVPVVAGFIWSLVCETACKRPGSEVCGVSGEGQTEIGSVGRNRDVLTCAATTQ